MDPIPTCSRCPDGPRLAVLQPLDDDAERLLCACPSCGLWFFRFEPGRGARRPDGRALYAYTELLPVPSRESLGLPPLQEIPPDAGGADVLPLAAV